MVRIVGLALAPVIAAGFVAMAVFILNDDWPGWAPSPEVYAMWLIGLGVLFSLVLLRFASICAKASPEGLFVRNILNTHRYEWSQIVSVSYSEALGDSWATLSLSDGTTSAVMAIQAADGPRAREATDRLRILVDEHTPPGGTT